GYYGYHRGHCWGPWRWHCRRWWYCEPLRWIGAARPLAGRRRPRRKGEPWPVNPVTNSHVMNEFSISLVQGIRVCSAAISSQAMSGDIRFFEPRFDKQIRLFGHDRKSVALEGNTASS